MHRLYLWSYGDPRGWAFSYERSAHVPHVDGFVPDNSAIDCRSPCFNVTTFFQADLEDTACTVFWLSHIPRRLTPHSLPLFK